MLEKRSRRKSEHYAAVYDAIIKHIDNFSLEFDCDIFTNSVTAEFFIDPCCDDIPAALLGKILEAISNVEKEWNSRFTNDINSFPPDIIYDELILE